MSLKYEPDSEPLQATRGMIDPITAATPGTGATPTPVANIHTSGLPTSPSGLPTSRPASTAPGTFEAATFEAVGNDSPTVRVASFTGAFAAQIGAPEGLQALDSPDEDSEDLANLLGGERPLLYYSRCRS